MENRDKEDAAIFEGNVRHPVYFIVGGFLLLISVVLFALAPQREFSLGFELYILASLFSVFAMMFVYWSIIGRKVRFYNQEFKFDQFLMLPRFAKISYSDIVRIEDLAPKNEHQKKLFDAHPYFVLHMKKGVKPNRIVLTNIKNERLGLNLETFLKSHVNTK